MKTRVCILALTLFAFVGTTELPAQSFLEKLGKEAVKRAENRVKQKVENKVNQKVDEAVDKPFNKAEQALKGNKGKEKAQQEAHQARQAQEAEAVEEAPQATQEAAAQTPPSKTLELTYAKSDFVRGDEVIFEDNLDGEQLGEFPSQWDLINGSVEVAQLNGGKVIMAQQVGDWITPLFEDMANYLPEKFTLEFDFWAEVSDEGYNIYHVYFHEGNGYHQREFQHIEVKAEGKPEYADYVHWGYLVKMGEDYDNRSGDLETTGILPNAWNHLAISFNKRAMKVYLNGTRVANIPNTVQPNSFSIEFTGDGVGRFSHASIKNIVLAKGAVPLYDRMLNEGKFITYGITFDVGKAVIKPESMGEINRIVQLLNENPSLRFSVEGHTDATGSAANNQKLSEARAQAIVDKLVELGIKADRLQAVGKGQDSPIADNASVEGRAKNRRVEFVKL